MLVGWCNGRPRTLLLAPLIEDERALHVGKTAKKGWKKRRNLSIWCMAEINKANGYRVDLTLERQM